MENGIKAVPVFDYIFSTVKHRAVNAKLDYSSNSLTYLKNAFTSDDMKMISINDLERLVNEYKNAKSGKQSNRCLLKGLYKDGYSGANCYQNSPYLFFDIDVEDSVKKKENLHLLCHDTNQIIFNELTKIAVLCWRSSSGNGIAGVLYVPQLANYLESDKAVHLNAGKAITSYLSDYLHNVTSIKHVKFDQAQSRFRQPRFLAEQIHKRKKNKQPLKFSYNVEKKQREIIKNVPTYTPSNYKSPYGTIYQQFNDDNNILDVSLRCGFSVVGSQNGKKVRVLHHRTASTSSGEVDQSLNVYFNYSESFGRTGKYTPSEMVCYVDFGNNRSDFTKYLRGLGYKDKHLNDAGIKKASKALKSELDNTSNPKTISEVIFKHTYNLQSLTQKQKQQFVKENCTNPEHRKYFNSYLKNTDYKIKYDKEILINKYVGEKTNEILDYVDQQGNTILRAETGKGKTHFVFQITKYRPKASILVLVPLTVIIEQNRKDHKGEAVFLDGTSTKADFDKAEYESIVFATYEQGTKVLYNGSFDYVIIDEVHQLLTANSFKRDVIADLTQLLPNSNVIGLTGTPNAMFKALGYNLLNVDVKEPIKTNVEVRFSNIKPYSIAISHIINTKGKTLVRLNDIKALKALKKHLIELKYYKDKEIFISYSDREIKNSKDYKQLAHERIFSKGTRLVLTTALIDEGLSIDQFGFTDVVFIDTSYAPRPEAIKQYFARFRNIDNNRNNYLYLRTKTNQTATNFNPQYDYNDRLKNLKEESKTIVLEDEGNINSNAYFFYEDATINPYYLAYEVTQNLFSFLNIEQFLEYLEINYNLELSKNDFFELNKSFSFYENKHRKEINQSVATAWIKTKDEVLQCLYLHTQSVKLRKEIASVQMYINPAISDLVEKHIKMFEKLHSKYTTLEKLGHNEPNQVLIKRAPDYLGVTLNSDKVYRDEITLLEIHRIVMHPKTKTDIRNRERLFDFYNWCKAKKRFTSTEMRRELKRLRVYKNSDLRFPQIERVLASFNLNIIKDSNSKDLIVF